MAVAGLGGAAMAAPVVGDHAEALAEEEQHLRVPIIGRQRPAVAKHDGLTFAPILVEDLNAVFSGDRVHFERSYRLRAVAKSLKKFEKVLKSRLRVKMFRFCGGDGKGFNVRRLAGP
jgi:hypothetical protein